MTTYRAADLPDGTVVADHDTAWIKNHPTEWSQWSGSNGGYFSNAHIDEKLADGAQVLRSGRRKEG